MRRRHGNTGFTLVELLLGLLLSGLLASMLVATHLAAQHMFMRAEESARMQEAGHFATRILAHCANWSVVLTFLL